MFIVLIVLIAMGFTFIWVGGMILGGIAAWQKLKDDKKEFEQPTHVNVLTREKPYEWSEELEGWDGAEELEIDEDI